MLRIIILNICFIYKTDAQNLVPNSDFEIYSVCPNNPELVNNAPPWDILVGGGGGTPDYFNSCATYMPYSVPSNVWGYQYARSGNAYSFFGAYCASSANFREYMQVPLIDTLKAGKEYCVKFYVSAADNYKYAADGIGAYFSPTAVSSPSNLVLPYTPQVSNTIGNIITDTMNWVKISGNFTAVGDEKYMVIGNFKNDASTNKSIINNGAVNTCAAYYIDDVSVMLCSDTAISVKEINNDKFKFNLYPNPNDGNMIFEYSLSAQSTGTFVLYDITGRVINKYKLTEGENNSLKITENQLTSGIYFYSVIIDGKETTHNKIVLVK